MTKIYSFRGKSENRPPEPKNGIWVPKSVKSCDIFFNQEFNIDEENLYFSGLKRQKLAL
jgi:hypothetical protein